MIAVRTGSWDGMSNQDLVVLVSKSDAEFLEKQKIEGELYSSFPYEKLNEKISLRVDDDSFATAWGAGHDKEGFYVRRFVFYGLKNTGKYLGARYDTLGNKIDIVNYERAGEHSHFMFLIGDLKYFELL